MKVLPLAITALFCATLTGAAYAQAQGDDSGADRPGPWMARIRLEGFLPANHSAPFSFMGSNFYGYELHASQKILFEGDISYFFSPAFALELSVNAPTPQNMSLGPVGTLGSIDVLQPMLTAQYHFVMKKSPITPYVGLGIAWNHLQAENFSPVGNAVNVTEDTSGFVYQLGLDIAVSSGFYVNVDYRHVQMIPNLKDSSGNILTDANISPNIFSIGVGFRF